MKSRSVKLAYAIAVVAATAAGIAAVMNANASLGNQYNFKYPSCPAQVLCPYAGSLPGSDYPVYLHAGTVAAVISIALTGAFLLLALLRRRVALFLVMASLSSIMVSVSLMYDGVDFIHFGDRATRVLLSALIGSGAAFIVALASVVTGVATKRFAGSAALIAGLVGIGATVPWLLTRIFVGS